ncbi:expressed unknown protein [Seminavis robusta]|uniref:Uncharacterized protein n=1 Tax=Seminavis robusta TaxID=568900 RepID=A0A9N8EHA8_9STRA|nr:expressed unknown protein [Seminavis robusta]|eukprot:Sro1098_g240970.1 n/a (202) ;mRNA; f:16006-16611
MTIPTAVEPGRQTPPPMDSKAFDQYSPQTITLRNHSDAIFRGMTAEADQQTAMMLMARRDQQPLFRPTKPYFPTTLPTAPSSRPIRITRRKQLQPRYHAAPKDTDPDAHLSASPTELQHYYDEASWRMYNLIQTARSEKQRAKAAMVNVTNDGMPAMNTRDNHHTFFTALPQHRNLSMPAPEEDLTTAVENEEGVFELDDL